MSAARVGSRIVAVRDADSTVVSIYGRGIYAGDFPRPGSGNWQQWEYDNARKAILNGDSKVDDSWVAASWNRAVAEGRATREEADARIAEGLANLAAERAKPLEQRIHELLTEMDLNPRLDLDNGTTVWGCECWWMPEQGFNNFLSGRSVVEVPVQRPTEEIK